MYITAMVVNTSNHVNNFMSFNVLHDKVHVYPDFVCPDWFCIRTKQHFEDEEVYKQYFTNYVRIIFENIIKHKCL